MSAKMLLNVLKGMCASTYVKTRKWSQSSAKGTYMVSGLWCEKLICHAFTNVTFTDPYDKSIIYPNSVVRKIQQVGLYIFWPYKRLVNMTIWTRIDIVNLYQKSPIRYYYLCWHIMDVSIPDHHWGPGVIGIICVCEKRFLGNYTLILL